MPKPSSPPSPLDSKSNPNDSGRIRSSRACLPCSRRKVKCDGLQPCSNCSKDSNVCEYGAQKKRGPPKGCDPRGGRKKKVPEPPSDATKPLKTTPAKRKPSFSSEADAASGRVNDARTAADDTRTGADRKPCKLHKNVSSSSNASELPGPDRSRGQIASGTSQFDPPQRDLYTSERATGSPSHSAIASLTARPSSEARFDTATSSQVSYDSHSAWSRSAYPQPGGVSPPLPRRSSHLAENVAGSYATSSHASTVNSHASYHAAASNLTQHYLQPQQHHQHHQSDYHHSDHSWATSSSDATRYSQQHLTPTPHHYDAYPLQSSLRDYRRSSPLSSHRSMPPPHTSTQATSDPTLQSNPDRAATSLPSPRTNAGPSATSMASPRSYPTRGVYESPSAHYHTGTSPYDRMPAVPSSSALSSRHPVSASRLTEPSPNSVSDPTLPAPSSTQSTGVNPSPAFTGASHGYSPSSTAMPHRPWYNGSQPPSPRGPGSIPRSQISSPGAHWLDYHVRPGSAAANHPNLSSKIHLEDRLPPHILQRLLDIYQVFVHPHWPIIYLPSVTSLHSLKRSRPIVFEAILAVASNTFDAYVDAASDDSEPSLNPVLEALYAESPQGSEISYKSNELRDHFVHRVKTRIFEGKFTQDIGTIQAAILISVIELGCGNTSSAFQFGGIACRMALDMNLHRCTAQAPASAFSASQEDSSRPDHSGGHAKPDPRRSGAQLQERVRVFWACFILDKILSTALDKPAQLRTAEIETDWPSVKEADEYDLWINETTRKFVDKSQLDRLEGVKVHALSSFKAWAEVMAILERILEEVYSPQAKRDRKRTKGASDYEALLRLNDRLSKWRAGLPPHLRWSGTWTSPELLSSPSSSVASADRKESDAHRGLPPHILTMRSWYCICLILLHRPRVPKLLEGPKERSATVSEEPDIVTAEANAATGKGKKNGAQMGKKSIQAAPNQSREPAGLDICNAAAKEVCDILHVYGSSFRIRKISSSWVYLIFQSATIHAALAASKSVVAFKARQSSIWSRRGSKIPSGEHFSSGNVGQHDIGPAIGEDADLHVGAADAEAHHVTEAELEGSSELVKTSALYLAECVRYLKRIGPTWQSASNHVAVLRNLCLASAQARPHSPLQAPAAATASSSSNRVGDPTATSSNQTGTTIKRENLAIDPGSHHAMDFVGLPGNDHQHSIGDSMKQDGPLIQSQNGSAALQQPVPPMGQHDQHLYRGHAGKDDSIAVAGTAATDLGIGTSDGLPSQFLQPQTYPAGPSHDQVLANAGIHHMQQQAVYPINANDAAFWASMPVASEGYNEWDEFFKAFNPSAGTDIASQHPNYHPTAAVDLITALQDPNRLLNGFQQQHQHQNQHH